MKTLTAAGLTGVSIVQPLAPTGNGWREFQPPQVILNEGWPVRGFFIGNISIFSSVEVVEKVDGSGLGPEYHVSLSKVVPRSHIERVPLDQALAIMRKFGDGWLEDNHVPNGKVRNFWRPVAEKLTEEECPCVETEPAVIEGDYVWRRA
jgi:hypothetical protein